MRNAIYNLFICLEKYVNWKGQKLRARIADSPVVKTTIYPIGLRAPLRATKTTYPIVPHYLVTNAKYSSFV